MAIVINGSGTITGVSVGGLPDGSVDSDTLATGIDVTKLADGTVTSAELQYINSLSSNAQTQISGAGGLVYIETVTAADSATVDLEGMTTAYDNYVVYAAAIRAVTDGATLQAQFQLNGSWATGASYDSAVIGYGCGDADDAVRNNTSSSTTAMDLTTNEGWFSAVTNNGVGRYEILNCEGVVSNKRFIQGHTTYQNTVLNVAHTDISGGSYVSTSGPISGIRFMFSSGNMTTGTFRLFGVKNS